MVRSMHNSMTCAHVLDTRCPHHVQQNHRAHKVVVIVLQRLVHTLPHCLEPGKVDHSVEPEGQNSIERCSHAGRQAAKRRGKSGVIALISINADAVPAALDGRGESHVFESRKRGRSPHRFTRS